MGRLLAILLVIAFIAAALGTTDAVRLPLAASHHGISHMDTGDGSAESPCAPQQDDRHHDHACMAGGTCLPGVPIVVAAIPTERVSQVHRGLRPEPEFGSLPFPEHRPPEPIA